MVERAQGLSLAVKDLHVDLRITQLLDRNDLFVLEPRATVVGPSSAFADGPYLEKMYEAGADDIFQKPFTLSSFVAPAATAMDDSEERSHSEEGRRARGDSLWGLLRQSRSSRNLR